MPAPTKSKISLSDVEPELAAVANEVKEVVTEVEDAVKTDAGEAVQTAVHTAEAVALGAETPEQGAAALKDEAEKVLSDAEAPVKDALSKISEDTVTTAIDNVEHVALEAGAAALETQFPAALPLIDTLEPLVETTVFHVTNVVTSDFLHKAETYIVELATNEIAKLHQTEIWQKIATKIEADLATGERILASALHVVKLDALAKFLPHE